MMGQQSGLQEQLFYEFRLDEWVPVDHLLRKIDAVLDLGSLRHELAPFYSHTRRPSFDLELMRRLIRRRARRQRPRMPITTCRPATRRRHQK
jgi:hypothetical protein